MVSLLCGCCRDKPIASLSVYRVFGCEFVVRPLTYRFYEKKNSNQLQLQGGFNGFQYNHFLQREKDLFDTSFYMANYSDSSWEQANVPLHMYFPDDEDDDTFYYKLGVDFLTPIGKDKMVQLPTASDISSYLVPDLIFDSPASDYFYFFIFCSLDFVRCKSELFFDIPSYYNSNSPFFFVSGVPSIFHYYHSDSESKLRLPFNYDFFNLCSRGLVYDFNTFFPIFKQGFSSAYSKFYNDVMNYNYHRSYFSVFRFSKKDYYAYLQNNSTAR